MLRQPEIDWPQASALGRMPLERVIFAGPLSEASALRIMSGVEFLSGYSGLHAGYPPDLLDSRVQPSLPLGQFRYYTDPRGVPLAFCNWAWLNGTILDEALATGRDPNPHEFNCGGLPFFYELFAPFGHCRAVVRDLRGLPFFKGRRIPAIRGETRGPEPFRPRVRYLQF